MQIMILIIQFERLDTSQNDILKTSNSDRKFCRQSGKKKEQTKMQFVLMKYFSNKIMYFNIHQLAFLHKQLFYTFAANELSLSYIFMGPACTGHTYNHPPV